MHLDKYVEHDEYFGIMVRSPLMDATLLAIKALKADAVEVVRCKDCKWRNTKGCPYKNFNAAEREDMDFCSDGERRTDHE